MAFFTPEARELLDYIDWINTKAGGGFMLTSDLKHWAEYGITTKDQLGDYLDSCVPQKIYDEECEDSVTEYHYDAPEPTWDAVSRHDSNEGW